MDILILDTNLEAVGVIDTYISLIWTDRFNESGDFEMLLPMDTPILNAIKEDYYLINDLSEHVMIIEDLYITTDVEDGKRLKITGHSLEKILDRRIIWNKTSFARTYVNDSDTVGTPPNLQNGIEKMLNENVISPSIAARRIDNFIFEASTDSVITDLTFEAQYYGESIYDIVSSLCIEKQIGFKITLNANKQFVFKLYAGEDRTYDQLKNPYIVFSPSNDNLFNSTYCRSKSSFKNVTLVAGEEPETKEETRTTIVIGNELGINRREVFTDASSVSSKVDDTTLTDAQYKAHLKQKGIDTLIENLEIEAFDGEVETTIMYRYGEDFFMGDIVQLEDEYGHEGTAYISEFIISQDESGISMYPTFITLQEGDYNTYE